MSPNFRSLDVASRRAALAQALRTRGVIAAPAWSIVLGSDVNDSGLHCPLCRSV